ncbi:WD40-repeat-containing domain protein [Dipodascopsis uninucleata]
MLPTEFGRQSAKKANFDAQYRRFARQEYIDLMQTRCKNDDDDDDDYDSDDDNEIDNLPISHELCLVEHNKTISALDMDPAGVRLASASYDLNLDLWDFNGMNPSSLKPFRTIEPSEGHHVHQVRFSNDGSQILVVPSSSQAKLFSRDGTDEVEFTRGDMYLVDMNNTTGHVAELTTAEWHPNNNSLFATASHDSTIRIWDVSVRRTQRNVIILKSKVGSGRTGKPHVSALAWSTDGRLLGGAATDGSLSLWPASGPYNRPTQSIQDAHEKGSWTSSAIFLPDSTSLLTRGGDHTIKLWDTRNFKRPVLIRNGLPNNVPETDVSVSPDGRFILSGTSAEGNKPGVLNVLDKSDLSTIVTLDLGSNLKSSDGNSTTISRPLSVVRTGWNARTNQIYAGTSLGSVHIIFSRDISSKGAKMVVERAPKVRHIDDDVTADIDLSSAAMTTVELAGKGRDQSTLTATQRQRRDRKDPVKSHKPEMPFNGAFTRSNPDSEHVQKNVALAEMIKEDPREALLKYAKEAEANPMFFNVYKKNEPSKIYADPNEYVVDNEDESSETASKKRKIRRD